MKYLDELEKRITTYARRQEDDRAIFNAQVKKLMQNEKEYKKRAREIERTYSLLEGEKSQFELK